MPSTRASKRAGIEERIAPLARIGETDWASLKAEFAPISDSYLRSVLRASGCPLHAMVEGVSTASLQDAERTLCALAGEYADSDAERKKRCRAAVIEAKYRLRWSMKRLREEDMLALKRELLLWVSTWLENPAVFRDWAGLRRHATDRQNLPAIPPGTSL